MPAPEKDVFLATQSGDGLAQFRMLFEANPIPEWVTDVETRRALEVNAAALALYGYSREEFLALDITELRAPEGREGMWEALAGPGTGTTVIEAVHVTRAGERLNVEVHYQRGRFQGRDAYFVAIIDRTRQVAAEARHERMMEIANDIIFTLDRAGTVRSANRMACEVTGYGREELVGMNAFQIVAPEHRGRALEALQLVWSGIDVQVFDTLIVTNDGRRVWLELRGRRLEEADGLVGTFHIARDVTERHEAERARAWLAAVVDSSDQAIIGRDLSGVVTSWNAAAERLYGYTAEEALGSGLDLLDPPETNWFEPGSPPQQRELVGRRKDGSQVAVGLTAFTVRDDQGRPIGIAALSHDITAEREAKRALEEAQSWIRAFTSAVPAVIWAVDANGTFRLLEGGWLRAWGLSPGALVGQSIFEYNADAPDRVSAVRRALAGEQFTERGTSQDVTYEAHYSPLRDAAGAITGATAIIFDATERERTEARLRQAEKLESLTILAGGIAHDFNNLLVGIIGNASLALLDLPADSPSRRSIEELVEAGQRAADLARQMLTYSGRALGPRTACNLGAIVAEAAVGLADGVLLTLDLAGDLPPVHGDPSQLRIAASALVANAVEAAADTGGTVTISTRTEECEPALFRAAHLAPELPGGRYSVLEVRDTGPGIAPETLPRIFDPFYTTRFTGRGLGLAAALGVARAHRGAIFVESEPGAGARFRFYLPASA